MSKHKGNKYRPNTNGAVVQAPGQTNLGDHAKAAIDDQVKSGHRERA